MNEFRVDILNQRGLAATYALEGLFEDFAGEVTEVLGEDKTREKALITTKLQEAYLFARHSIGMQVENRIPPSQVEDKLLELIKTPGGMAALRHAVDEASTKSRSCSSECTGGRCCTEVT